MQRIGIFLLFILVFIACQKEKDALSPNTNTNTGTTGTDTTTMTTTNLPVLIGLYWGAHSKSYTSPSGSTSNRTDSVYAIVDTIGTDQYRIIICEDSLLTGVVFDTIDIDLQSQPLRPCDLGLESYLNTLPGGVIHNVNLVITTCDSIYISTQYNPISSHSGSGDSFHGLKLH